MNGPTPSMLGADLPVLAPYLVLAVGGRRMPGRLRAGAAICRC
jgi:hypothetical protein